MNQLEKKFHLFHLLILVFRFRLFLQGHLDRQGRLDHRYYRIRLVGRGLLYFLVRLFRQGHLDYRYYQCRLMIQVGLS
jgi:hypothetical protein